MLWRIDCSAATDLAVHRQTKLACAGGRGTVIIGFRAACRVARRCIEESDATQVLVGLIDIGTWSRAAFNFHSGGVGACSW